jgi:replicative DNA helicase
MSAALQPVSNDHQVIFSNPDAEMMLLSAIMIHNDTLGEIAEHVRPDDFSDAFHRFIFGATIGLIAKGVQANPVTLRPLLVGTDAEIKRSWEYLVGLSGDNRGTSLVGFRDIAVQVGELGRVRRLVEGVEGRILKLRQEGVEWGEAVKFATEIEAMAYAAGEMPGERSKTFSIADSIDRVIGRIEEIRRTGEPIGATAPDIPELSEVVGPLERSHFHVWAGRPGMGKSGLMCSAARSFASNGHGVGIISLEMSDVDLGTRFCAEVALSLNEPIRHDAIRDAKVTDSELKSLIHAAEMVREMPIRLADLNGITLSRVAMKARQMKRELEARGHTLDVLFVDYLQLVHSDRTYDNKVAEVTDVSAGLKRLAKELDCAVVALSQLSRKTEERDKDDKRPRLSDLRDSGSIEQDADTVCFLYREEYYLKDREPNRSEKPALWEAWDVAMMACRDELELLVPKRRSGKEGKAKVQFLRTYQSVRSKGFVMPTRLGI